MRDIIFFLTAKVFTDDSQQSEWKEKQNEMVVFTYYTTNFR